MVHRRRQVRSIKNSGSRMWAILTDIIGTYDRLKRSLVVLKSADTLADTKRNTSLICFSSDELEYESCVVKSQVQLSFWSRFQGFIQKLLFFPIAIELLETLLSSKLKCIFSQGFLWTSTLIFVLNCNWSFRDQRHFVLVRSTLLYYSQVVNIQVHLSF